MLMFCTECGQVMADEAKFCAFCGTRRAMAPASGSEVQAPAAPPRVEAPTATAPPAPVRTIRSTAEIMPMRCVRPLQRLRWSSRRRSSPTAITVGPAAEWPEEESAAPPMYVPEPPPPSRVRESAAASGCCLNRMLRFLPRRDMAQSRSLPSRDRLMLWALGERLHPY